MNEKISMIVSVVSLLIALGTLIFLLGYYKAKIDRVIELGDLNAEKLRIEQIVSDALDKRLKTILDYLNAIEESNPEGIPNRIPPEVLSAEFLKVERPENGAIITEPVITVSGSHSLPLNARVWILLGDGYGNFYLQNPPVILRRDGKWSATNIRPGQGITAIHAALVDESGNREFLEMVSNKQWGGFTQLPASARILATIDVTTRN